MVLLEVGQLQGEYLGGIGQIDHVGTASFLVTVVVDLSCAHGVEGLELVLEGTRADPTVFFRNGRFRVELWGYCPLGAVGEVKVSRVIRESSK